MSILEYGVCRLSVVPVRSDPNHGAVQVTQLLFGDHYEVMEISGDRQWGLIRQYADQSEGWMDWKQHHSISEEYFQQINKTDYKITTEIASPVLYKKSPLTIVMGSVVPISSSELFKIEEQFAFNGESKGLGQRRDADFITITARKYLSAPYQWGGKSPFGIDHVGLVQMVFRIAGYLLPRDIKQLVLHGKKVKSFDESRAGDVVFLAAKGNTVSHCGILLDDCRIIHAFGHVRIDVLTEEGIVVPETKVYTHFLHSIRRMTG